MSTIKSSAENLTLNADGANNDIKFQSNGSEVASIDQAGSLVLSGNLTSLGIDDNADATAITIDASENVGIGVTPANNALGSSLQIGSGGQIIGDTGETVYLGTNFYYNSGFKRIAAKHVAMQSFTDSGKHIFYTAGTDSADSAISLTTAMTIHNTGGVSVGTGTSISSGNILVNDGIYISSSNGDYQIRGNSTGGGSATLYIGNKSIDTTASDARFKDVIGDCTNGLEVVKALTVKDYTWKEGFDSDTTTVMSGLLAQEVELVDPSLVTKPTPKEAVEPVEEVRDADGNITIEAVEAVEGVNASDEGWSVKYQMVVPKLIQAIQELEARITALEA